VSILLAIYHLAKNPYFSGMGVACIAG